MPAYRVVQEGLTNARKHAPGAAAEVTVTAGRQAALVAEVISHRPANDPLAMAAPDGAGAGLIGLAERLALVGGELEYSTNTAGDFVLRATVPRRT